MSSYLSNRLSNFDSSKIRAAFEFAEAIPNPIDLSIGFPEDDTPNYIKAAAIEAISNNHTRYTPSNGLTELREAIAHKLSADNGILASAEQVSVTPGVTMGIFLSYLSVLDPGDEILLAEPYFPPYRDLAVMLGAKPVIVDTAPTFQLTVEQLQPYISPKTKVLAINSPNNPSGAIYPEAELRKMAEFAKKHNLLVISDEVYEHFAYDKKHFSIGSIYPNTLTLNGFSKSYAMTGWRVGYVHGPPEIIKAINELQQYTVFSSPSISQHAAIGALNQSPRQITHKYKHKRDKAYEILSTKFPDIYGAQGAFYFFLKLPIAMPDMGFVNHLAHRGVIILPGSAFSHYQDYIRIAFGAEDEKLEKGLKLVCESIDILNK